MQPKHIAIVMDGNGRWAKQRGLPRVVGHRAGIESVRRMVKYCGDNHIEVLSLFSFSQENWRRPLKEVRYLMALFLRSLKKEVDDLHKNNVCIRFIGDRSRFDEKLQRAIDDAEQVTARNTGLKLVFAMNYSGRWDIVQACQRIVSAQLPVTQIDENQFNQFTALADLPAPDLLIRTSGEQRISNFFLWQLAYAELFFSPTLWPDFQVADLEEAIKAFQSRERRFGLTSEQVVT